MRAQIRSLARRFAWIKRFSADRAGAAAIEFALGSVILFSLTMGIIDIGRVMFTINSIEHATKEGARFAAIHGAQSLAPEGVGITPDVETFVKDNTTGIDTTPMTVNVTWEDPLANAPGTTVTVATTYPFSFFFAAILPTTSFDLTAQSVYTISR